MTKFEMYFSYRRNIIALYGNKKIKKKLYLFKILDAIFMISIEPIKKVDTFEKALFNYQYYKAMAEDAENDKLNHKDEEHILVCKKQEDYYISQREIALEYVLDFINYSGVKAYFVKIRRKELKNKLFEIFGIFEYNLIKSFDKISCSISAPPPAKTKSYFVKSGGLSPIEYLSIVHL